MTRRKRARAGVIGVAAVALAATAFTGPAQPAQATASRPAGHETTQRAIDAALAAGVTGVAVEVRDADGVWKSASGVGNRLTGAPRGKNDRFRVGGLTGTFVATVLLQMEAENKLDLDDTVDRHLPGLVKGNGNDGSRITVRQLLNHTSGLYDYLADQGYYETYVLGDGFLQHRYDTLTPEQRVKVALGHPPQFTPGARLWFSHTNDVLAALIVQKAGGRPYEDEVRERIIEPLGLRSTSNPGTGTGLPRPSSRSYSRLFLSQPDRIDDVTELNGSQIWGDGDIISTTGDVNRFHRALIQGRLLPPEQMAELTTTVPNPDFPGAAYGLNLEKLTLSCGTPLWFRDGGTTGSLTMTASTEDGGHLLTFNYNNDWGAETLLPVLNAEFCDTPVVSGTGSHE
ncbi:serine hydrolase domain-containing protein [Streptomyces pseudogriseolus]|uniref:serine hydrolase domain-containing protein n=1 Tax=Streptomyces pseudogriseolus TaxID=36817 RepID=UPI003FA2BDB1